VNAGESRSLLLPSLARIHAVDSVEWRAIRNDPLVWKQKRQGILQRKDRLLALMAASRYSETDVSRRLVEWGVAAV
jgi:hypothetical protein